MVAPAGASLTPMTGVTSVGTGATTPMTATALAREGVVVAAGEGIKSVSIAATGAFIRACRCALSASKTERQKVENMCLSLPSGLALDPDLALGPGHADAAIVLAHAAVATAGTSALTHRRIQIWILIGNSCSGGLF